MLSPIMNAGFQVAIIIVSYNTRALLLECLASVIDSTSGQDIELVVVDNASSDGSSAAVRDAYPQAMVIDNSTNLGFGVACNQGIKATRAPFVLLVNSDARLTAEAFRALCDCLCTNDRCGAAGCRMIHPTGVPFVNTRNFLTLLNQAIEQAGVFNWLRTRQLRRVYRPALDDKLVDCSVDWIEGACLMLRRAALDEVGLFDEQFFMYSEDEDLCLRLKQRGWSICFSAAGTVIHVGGASTEKCHYEMLRQFYLSQMLFLRKHRGRGSVLAYRIAMQAVFIIKLILARLPSQSLRRQEMAQRLSALRHAGASLVCAGKDQC